MATRDRGGFLEWAEVHGQLYGTPRSALESARARGAVRTALNVRDSDATLILSHGQLAGGSLLTLQEAFRAGKPVLHLDLDRTDVH